MASAKGLDQSKEAMRSFAAVTSAGAVSAAIYKYFPFDAPDATTTLDKLVYTARWQVFSFLTFLVGVQLVAFKRFLTPAVNPLDKSAQHYVEAYNRCLQNTLEQLVLNVSGQLILCTYLDADTLLAIPFLVSLFVLGRILFWLGYPAKRSAGHFLTFLPTVATYCVNVYYMLTVGPSFRIGQKTVS